MLLYVTLAFIFCQLGLAQIADNMLPFIGAPQGISFTVDNGNYLKRYYTGGVNYVAAETAQKSPFTKFHVYNVSDETGSYLAFECDGEGTGWFWQVVETWEFLLQCYEIGSVDKLGPWNYFQTYSLNDGRNVALRVPEKGLYLKRYFHSELDYMAAMDYDITEFSTLGYDAASVHPIEYEILDLVFDTTNQDPTSYTPIAVDYSELENDSNLPFDKEVTLTFSQTRTETTTWENSFGIMSSFSYASGLIPKLVANIEFELTATYDYLYGGSSEVSKTVEYSESVTVTAEPGMMTTVTLAILEQEDATIPFDALVKWTYIDDVTGELITQEKWEAGTWYGVLMYETKVDVTSEPLPSI